MKKALAFLTASVMALGSLPFLSVGAEDAFAPGDVDMDGVITGHDAALVSRHLVHGDNNLSEEQLKLADYNGDGVVDQTDADLIHENEAWILGDVDMDGYFTLGDAFETVMQYSYTAAGVKYDLTQVQINLSDICGLQPGTATLDSAVELQCYFSEIAAGLHENLYKFQESEKDIYDMVDGIAYYFRDNAPVENE